MYKLIETDFLKSNNTKFIAVQLKFMIRTCVLRLGADLYIVNIEDESYAKTVKSLSV